MAITFKRARAMLVSVLFRMPVTVGGWILAQFVEAWAAEDAAHAEILKLQGQLALVTAERDSAYERIARSTKFANDMIAAKVDVERRLQRGLEKSRKRLLAQIATAEAGSTTAVRERDEAQRLCDLLMDGIRDEIATLKGGRSDNGTAELVEGHLVRLLDTMPCSEASTAEGHAVPSSKPTRQQVIEAAALACVADGPKVRERICYAVDDALRDAREASSHSNEIDAVIDAIMMKSKRVNGRGREFTEYGLRTDEGKVM